MGENLAVFTSCQGERAVLAAHEAALAHPGTAFEELDVATSFGKPT